MLTRFAYLIIVVVVGIAALGVYQLTSGRLVEATTVVTAPAQSAVDAPFGFLSGIVGELQSVGQLRAENDALRAEVDRLRQETVRNAELEHENQLLREQANYREQHQDQQTVSARIIGRDPNPLVDSVTIDQGTSSGVADGMVVVAPAGLVGRITRAGPSSAKVLLLTSGDSAVNCIVQATRARGVAEGDAGGTLAMRYVGQGEPVKVGDQVVTSGLGGMFPSGLLVGEVSDVRRTDSDLVQDVKVRPAVDVQALERVLVITSYRPSRLD